jgi:hypothetical protein
LAKRFKLFKDRESATEYLDMEMLANEMVQAFRIKKWQSFLKEQGSHPLSSISFWRRINRLRSNKRHNRMGTILINGRTYESAKEKADLFAENLKEKFTNDNNA